MCVLLSWIIFLLPEELPLSVGLMNSLDNCFILPSFWRIFSLCIEVKVDRDFMLALWRYYSLVFWFVFLLIYHFVLGFTTLGMGVFFFVFIPPGTMSSLSWCCPLLWSLLAVSLWFGCLLSLFLWDSSCVIVRPFHHISYIYYISLYTILSAYCVLIWWFSLTLSSSWHILFLAMLICC